MVEDKVSSPRVQTFLLALTVFSLLILGVGYDYVSASSANQAAKQELENQKRINQQMLAVQREQADLERKSQDIQGRIDQKTARVSTGTRGSSSRHQDALR
jgi:type II secretory pathway component PulJ